VLVSIPLAAAKKRDEADVSVTNAAVRDSTAMKEFWKDHASLRRPFAACSSCLSPHAGSSCAARAGGRSGPAMQREFVRLFNAMRMSPALVPAAFRAFHDAAKRRTGPSASGEPGVTYCLFVELVESEVEQRAGYSGWSADDVDQTISAACAVALGLTRQIEGETNQATIGPWEANLRRFQLRLDRLYDIEQRPFPGCEACMRPCQFRFDLERIDASESVARLVEALVISESEERQAEMLAACLDVGVAAFLEEDLDARIGAAVCFAAQQFFEMELTTTSQTGLTAWVGIASREAGSTPADE
jgi:hypothetical protein